MTFTSVCRRVKNIVLAGAVLLILAWSVASLLSGWYFVRRMEDLAARAQNGVTAVNEQVNQILAALHVLEGQQSDCTPSLYRGISELVAANRFIYEAAIQLSNGKACSSYGHETNKPSSLSLRRFARTNLDYWFFTDQHKKTDDGFIVVSYSDSYVWLNKGIVSNALNLDDRVGFDLVDVQLLESVLSFGAAPVKLASLTAVGTLSLGTHGLHYVTSNQWYGLVSVLTLPRSDYQKVWWGFFFLTLGGGLVVPLWLYRLLKWGRTRYFSIVPKLRKALKHDELRMSYQPIVDIQTGAWVGVESLIRWSPGATPLPPAVFIQAAEQAGMINEVTRWVVRRVAEDYCNYLWACSGLYITINLSAQDLETASFGDYVRELLAHYGVPTTLIVFEVTESVLVDRVKAVKQLQALRDQGHRIAVDDFGTGYSSLSYVNELPLDILKIDRSFLELKKMQADDALWRHVAQMAHALKLTVIAEGIEDPAQAEELSSAGVQFAQGWLYSKDFAPATLARHFFQLRI